MKDQDAKTANISELVTLAITEKDFSIKEKIDLDKYFETLNKKQKESERSGNPQYKTFEDWQKDQEK
jgi:hypothetical protein